MRNCLIELLSLNALLVLPAFTPEVIMLSKRGLSMVWTLLFPEALLSTLPLLSPNQIVSETWKVPVCLVQITLSCKSRYFSWPQISLFLDSQQPMLELHSTTCWHLVSEQHGEDGCLDGLAEHSRHSTWKIRSPKCRNAFHLFLPVLAAPVGRKVSSMATQRKLS